MPRLCTLEVTAAAGQSSSARLSLSRRNRLLTYLAQAALAWKNPSSLRPLLRMSLSIKYTFIKITELWTTVGMSLFRQILCEGGIDVRNNFTNSHPTVRFLDCLRQPMLKFLPLISVPVIAFGAGGWNRGVSTAAPSQVDHTKKVRRKCWRSRLYQIWSRWRLLNPDPAGTVLHRQ